MPTAAVLESLRTARKRIPDWGENAEPTPDQWVDFFGMVSADAKRFLAHCAIQDSRLALHCVLWHSEATP
jgi:hypothetical protein